VPAQTSILDRSAGLIQKQETMRKINTAELEEYSWTSPKGDFRGAGKDLSQALGWDPAAAGVRARHPFAVEILRVAPGQKPYPYHSHSAQWEFYHVVSGHGLARDDEGEHPIEPGDAFVFGPGEAHQLINNGGEDLVIFVVADNPLGESSYYPDSKKWIVRSPERRLLRSEPLDYYDGEE
jgi:uncharacterized cupin superfamily protein